MLSRSFPLSTDKIFDYLVLCKELTRFSYATTIYFDIRSTRESLGVGEDAYRGPWGEL